MILKIQMGRDIIAFNYFGALKEKYTGRTLLFLLMLLYGMLVKMPSIG
jgi:hypothetical protein